MSSFPVNPTMEDMLIAIAALIISLKSLHLIICTKKCISGGGDVVKREKETNRRTQTEREREGSREGREKTIGWARCFLFP